MMQQGEEHQQGRNTDVNVDDHRIEDAFVEKSPQRPEDGVSKEGSTVQNSCADVDY